MTSSDLRSHQFSGSHMGAEGEQFVLAYERKRLPEYFHSDIVRYGDDDIAMGYDILSFESPESLKPDRYIEVKTYRGHKHFYWSEGEITAAHLLTNHYYLYLVDYDRINDPYYTPEIICNPSQIFDHKSHWISQPIQYVFSELSPENIPSDWFESTVLVGCYNSPAHLQWILSNCVYNVRAKAHPDDPSPFGEVHIDNPHVRQASYLILYQIGVPQSFMLFALDDSPALVTSQQLIDSGYSHPHMPLYVVHHIARQLPSFYVNLLQLFREALPKIDNALAGQPLYLTGLQLKKFMALQPAPVSAPTPAPSSTPSPAPTPSPSPVPPTPTPSPVPTHNNSPKQGAFWSRKDDVRLLSMLQSSVPIADISRQLTRTDKAIMRRMDRLRAQDLIPADLYQHYRTSDPAFLASARFYRPRS